MTHLNMSDIRALEISDIPFAGPIASVRVGRVNGQFVINPAIQELEKSDINLIIAGSKTGVVMVVYLHEALDKRLKRGNITKEEITEATLLSNNDNQPIVEIDGKIYLGYSPYGGQFILPQIPENLEHHL